MTLPASFFFWVFIPSRGVVKAVCEPTTRDPETAEVASTVLADDDRLPLRAAYDADTQRRLDEAASDALEDFMRGVTEDDVEQASKDRADAEDTADFRWPSIHPEDRPLPAWQE